MKTPVVFLLSLGLALARGDGTPDKVNQLETKNIHQVVKPPVLETASTRNEDLQIAHMKYQANRMENQDLNIQQHSQLQNSQSHIQNQASHFYNHNQAPQIHSPDPAQQLHNRNQVPFHNQDESQIRQFHDQDRTATGFPVHPDQETPSHLQSHQRMTSTSIPSTQSQSKGQALDFSSQLYSSSIHPEQDFYQDRSSVVGVQDHLSESRFRDSSNNQIISGLHSSEIKTGGFPQIFHQRSAFDNREQPIVLPGVSQTHSSSVVVSGLKNLPALPALVYSAGTVPSAHAVTYSRPWFQGGAYVRQHWQTPFARYVYSHIL